MHLFNSVAGAIVAVAFWIFLTASAIAGMKYDFRKRQLAMDSLRAAIERGQSLDPAVVEKLLAQQRGPHADGLQDLEQHLRIGGVITIAAGIGVLIAAFFVGLQFPIARLPMLGAGALAVCVGLGLLVAAGTLGRYRPRGSSPDSVA
jgi:hypothetical protein